MSKTHEIKVTKRELQRKGASRRLRHAGVIPAIVYGGNAEPVAISLDHNEIWLAQYNDWFYSSILDLNLDGKVERVLLRDMQRHPFKQLILHLDFLRVNENEVLTASVPLHFINEETSPAGKASDIVVTHEVKEVTVSCLPKDLPESIEVDLGALEAGGVIHLSDLKLPKGVELPALALGKDHDDAVVTAKHGKEDAADTAEDAEAAE